MSTINNLKVRSKLITLVGICILGLAGFAAYAYTSMSTVEVNGPIYTHIVQGKDLIADILPPPEYIIESYLNTLQIINAVETKADQSIVNQLIEKAKTLRTDYEQRHAYWVKELPEGTLKQTLVASSYDPALAFFNARDADFLPAIQAGELDKAKTVALTELQPKYEEHRAAIDKVVSLANERNTQDEQNTANLISQTTTLLVVICLVVVIVSAVVSIVISNNISRPLGRTVEMIREMSLGHLGTRLKMDRKDEIGVMATTLDQFADDLQVNVIGTMQKIAAGDLSTDVKAKDAHDEISPALRSTTNALRGLIDEVKRLTQAAIAGKLETRGETGKFQGGYREIIQGVNNTLDAVVEPLNVAAEYVERISRGDIPEPITDTYHGDFNELKNNLNQCIHAINALITDVNLLNTAGVEGQLATRADASKHQGEFRKIVQGMNDTMSAVIGPLTMAAHVIDQLAEGDIPQPIAETYRGDFEKLKGNLNALIMRLREMLTSISDAANNLSSAATEILAATTQQTAGASEQSAAIAQTTTTFDELKTISEHSVMRAKEVASASQRTVEVARSGQRSVQDTIESMTQIKERVEGIAENILALSGQTQQIGEIIATVNNIASQSNMLALNASVEAARAGEHGKGFAVVAVEVRNLAEQSKQATAQVKAILSDIQKATNATVMATEEGTKGVDQGVKLAAQTREAIEQLSGVINESAQTAMQVVAGGQQQSTGIDQVALAMTNINQATVQSLASTRQAEKAAQNLNELARRLTDTLAHYRLSGNGKSGHGLN
jgi:methyl-accepting chemotaxis protein